MATDNDALAARLTTLQADFDKGNSQLVQLDRETALLREKLLRLHGAMLILQEFLAPPAATREG